ncbi:MAG: baseplate J/gp47 family protein [Rhodospirillales bacterium]|nr:baseplate J/gp47 family protein [Rhodospirillales bacterium]
MPLSIPSLDDLRAQVRGGFAARLPGADVTFRRAVVRIAADVFAGALWLGYRSLLWISRQIFIATAEGSYLDTRMAPYNFPRLGATFAAGNAIFTGIAATPIPAGTQLSAGAGSVLYATQAAAVVGAGGTVSVPIEALTAGSAGNADAGALLTVATAIAGVQAQAAADGAGLNGGTDAETDAAYRARAIARVSQPPQGGAGTDYLAWAKTVAGVTRAWVYPLNRGPGTVDVTFVLDGRTNNIPLSADLAAVQAVLTAQAPVQVASGGNTVAYAPVADALAVTVHAMVPNDSGTQAAVTAQIAALARTVAPGGATIGDGVSTAAPGGTLYLSQIEGAILAAGTVTHFDLIEPAADVTFAVGHLPATPTVTFT